MRRPRIGSSESGNPPRTATPGRDLDQEQVRPCTLRLLPCTASVSKADTPTRSEHSADSAWLSQPYGTFRSPLECLSSRPTLLRRACQPRLSQDQERVFPCRPPARRCTASTRAGYAPAPCG